MQWTECGSFVGYSARRVFSFEAMCKGVMGVGSNAKTTVKPCARVRMVRMGASHVSKRGLVVCTQGALRVMWEGGVWMPPQSFLRDAAAEATSPPRVHHKDGGR